ncbi:uncharacterized protein LOC113273265 [Papaver somniferum]|uniref:uncharacterized protein LOC113273265 n=1 Tax=Papaver somniferum TaxID=3469 RepID=UPI000E6FB5D9|nr:uncharacterized protein LOC113273265 [Papaver somniferum]
MTPFKALYEYQPPHLAFPLSVTTAVADMEEYIKERDHVLSLLKENLHKAQERMKFFADKNRVDGSLDVGDEVYLKLQPYRQTSIALKRNLKLSAKYYGPFKVVEKIGSVAHNLQLPVESRIHPVFHVSQLKKKLGAPVLPVPEFSLVDQQGQVKVEPASLLGERVTLRNNIPIPRLLIQ